MYVGGLLKVPISSRLLGSQAGKQPFGVLPTPISSSRATHAASLLRLMQLSTQSGIISPSSADPTCPPPPPVFHPSVRLSVRLRTSAGNKSGCRAVAMVEVCFLTNVHDKLPPSRVKIFPESQSGGSDVESSKPLTDPQLLSAVLIILEGFLQPVSDELQGHP